MKKTIIRIIAIVMALLMVLGIVAVAVFAEANTIAPTGDTGTGKWVIALFVVAAAVLVAMVVLGIVLKKKKK